MPLKMISRLFMSCVTFVESKILNSKSLMGLLSIDCKYCVLSIICQLINLCTLFFNIISHQIRIVLPFPSKIRWAIFISTYLVIISSKEFSGICSTFTRISFEYKAVANLYPPLAMFFISILLLSLK